MLAGSTKVGNFYKAYDFPSYLKLTLNLIEQKHFLNQYKWSSDP